MISKVIKQLTQSLLTKLGKQYALDEEIPTSLIIREYLRRFVMLARGGIRFRKKCFVGNNVKLRGNIKLGSFVTIESNVEIDGYAKHGVQLANGVKIGAHSIISVTSHLSKYGSGLDIGEHSGFGQFCYFGCAGGVKIGSHVIGGQYISFHAQSHVFEDTCSPIISQGVIEEGIILGNDIWIGAKVTFLDGAELGNHCVVAAGSVVKDKFPDGSVIAGIPARLIRNRLAESL